MKQYLTLIFLIVVLFNSLAIAQAGYQDVVYLKNGGKVIGIIIEQIPNISIKIETSNGSVMSFKMDEIERIVKEKKGAKSDEPAIAPPPIRTEREADVRKEANHTGLLFEGTSASFAIGSHTVKAVKTESIVNGKTGPELELDPYTGMVLIAQVIFQGSDNLALLLGGTVDKYAGGAFTSYYLGGHYYFTKDKFQPFLFAKGGYGFGNLDDPFDEDETVKFTGPYFTGGIGTKFYLDNSWGLYGEAGYKYQGTSATWDIKGTDGRTYEVENTQNIAGFQFMAGFFFYP